MSARSRRPEDIELLSRKSSDSDHSTLSFDLEQRAPRSPALSTLRLPTWLGIRLPWRIARVLYTRLPGPRKPRRRSFVRRLYAILIVVLSIIILLVLLTATFRPSYTHPPDHYVSLEKRVRQSSELGRGNIDELKVFIAATLYDPKGTLVGGEWGNAVKALVDILGPENVYVSVFENDASQAANEALENFRRRLTCNSTIISEHLPLEDIASVTIPSGEQRPRRVAFLAEARNRALNPLSETPPIHFDRLLFINDIMFNPIDAANLLFSTNINSTGKADYAAVCAMDFINAFKFYDRFALRDMEGFESGIPFFPWFTDSGTATSRNDVLNQRDAVRVRACWGGMAAFEAKWFQETAMVMPSMADNEVNFDNQSIKPLRFRYESDVFWEASECCLIHADLAYLRHGSGGDTGSGIFMNPYIRVAYDSRTLGWLPFTRRAERLYSLIHTLLNHLVGIPWNNPRRLDRPGDVVTEKIWIYDENDSVSSTLKGSYRTTKSVARPGRFCGRRDLMVLNISPKDGEKSWSTIPVPPVT